MPSISFAAGTTVEPTPVRLWTQADLDKRSVGTCDDLPPSPLNVTPQVGDPYTAESIPAGCPLFV